jgi:hypothetical protein
MKKLIFVLVLIMAVLTVTAQTTQTTQTKQTTTTKSTSTKVTPVRSVVMVNDLQKPIIDNISKDYAGYTTKEATRVSTGSNVKYEVVVVKGTKTETLEYDNNGKFIKKLTDTKISKK